MNWKDSYPAKYYAYSNTDVTLGGYPVVGWVDISIFTQKPDWLPAASAMIPLTQAEWDARTFVTQIVKDGAITAYVPATTTTT